MSTKLKFLMEGLKKCIAATGKEKEQLQAEMVLFINAADPEEIFGDMAREPANAKEADERMEIFSELLPLLKDGIPGEYDKHKALFDGLSLMLQGLKEIKAKNAEQGLLPELPSLADLKQEARYAEPNVLKSITRLRWLITGGAGSLGRKLVAELLKPEYKASAICVLDNHENSLARLRLEHKDDNRLRYFLGDIQDFNRIKRAMESVDIAILAAAYKHVDLCAYNPFESVNVNVIGTQRCIEAAIAAKVPRVLYLSSDKSVNPCSTYGYCKALSEHLIIDANNLKGDAPVSLSVCRPPNYYGSDGSMLEIWQYQLDHNLPLTVTDERMERYFLTFPEIVEFLLNCLDIMHGGEIFVPVNAKKMKIIDLAKKLSQNIVITGMRKGERLTEYLYSDDEMKIAHPEGNIWVIKPGD